MRVLVVGSGGREHALAWKLAQEAEVFATPGNPGIADVATCLEGEPLQIAKDIHPHLVVVGPENPLIDGLADRLRAHGFPTFGPGADGALLEGSKAFSKEKMIEAGVPTADYAVFRDAHGAHEFARARFGEGRQVVVKASGAALGKGVVVCGTLEEAEEAIEMMLVAREFCAAGGTVVIEDRLIGREFSLLTVCSGTQYVSLPIAQDYKRALDGDRGPNTGGMGTCSPASWVDEGLLHETEVRMVAPLLRHLASEGIDYRGVLFSGIMVADGRPYCLEYNVRFGDPETQTIMRRLGSGLGRLLSAASREEDLSPVEVLPQAAVTVVAASGGYPGTYEKGMPISLPTSLPEGVVVFHAGTAKEGANLVTAGGRVLGVSAVGDDLEAARTRVYNTFKQTAFEGMTYRTDIGQP